MTACLKSHFRKFTRWNRQVTRLALCVGPDLKAMITSRELRGYSPVLKRMIALAGLLLVMFAPAAHAQYVPGQPGFILEPDTLPEGGGVSHASGVGCPPDSHGTFTINGQTVGTTVANSDPDGLFSTDLQIPASLGPGEYTVVLECGGVVMTNSLTITAVPTSATAGQAGGSALPRTGTDVTVLVRIGLALAVVGGLFVLGARKKRARV